MLRISSCRWIHKYPISHTSRNITGQKDDNYRNITDQEAAEYAEKLWHWWKWNGIYLHDFGQSGGYPWDLLIGTVDPNSTEEVLQIIAHELTQGPKSGDFTPYFEKGDEEMIFQFIRQKIQQERQAFIQSDKSAGWDRPDDPPQQPPQFPEPYFDEPYFDDAYFNDEDDNQSYYGTPYPNTP